MKFDVKGHTKIFGNVRERYLFDVDKYRVILRFLVAEVYMR